MSFTDESPCGRPRLRRVVLAIWSRPAKSWVNVIKCDHRGGKCDHRIFGRPVWDQLFFRRVPREAPKPRSRPPSMGTFIVQLVAGSGDHPANRALTHTAGQASDRLLFRRVSTRTFHRSACGKQPLARGHRAGCRGGAGEEIEIQTHDAFDGQIPVRPEPGPCIDWSGHVVGAPPGDPSIVPRTCSHRISGHLHKECAGPWAQLMHGFFPTGANRMARRIILSHPFISGKNLPATEALPSPAGSRPERASSLQLSCDLLKRLPARDQRFASVSLHMYPALPLTADIVRTVLPIQGITRIGEHLFWDEQFHACLVPNNATRLSGMEWLWAAKRA
jgi:hypothetical protein